MEVFRGDDEGFRNYSIYEKLLFTVDIVEKELERFNPLLDSGFKLVPFRGIDNSRNEINRKRTFNSRKSKSDSLHSKVEIALLGFCDPFIGLNFAQFAPQIRDDITRLTIYEEFI
jgi:hypothetical protein